jgi:transposase
VELVIRQQEVIEKLNKKIAELEQEVERLKASRDLDSKRVFEKF